MKLISKFHDYYDSVLSMGRDDTIVYIRHTEKIELDKTLTDEVKELFDNIPSRTYSPEIGCFFPVFFCFCGKIYLAYRFQISMDNYTKSVDLMLYSVKDMEDVIEKYEMTGWDRTERRWDKVSFYYKRKFLKENVEEAFKKYSGETVTNFNITYKTPVIVIEHPDRHAGFNFVLNPVLREYDFMRLFDPYTAFQEISMYLGGVLGNVEPPMLEVDEKTKISQHGYDKWSFRRMPGDKKGRRNEKTN